MNTCEPQEMMQALLLVLMDRHQAPDAIFVHGGAIMSEHFDNEVLRLAYGISSPTNIPIVINGVTHKESIERHIGYPGVEVWIEKLKQLGIPSDSIETIPPSLHTGSESENLITLAQEKKWQHITIIGLPHHILRCMLQAVYFIEQKGLDIKVYARTLPWIENWHLPVKKPILESDETIRGTLFNHIGAEYERVLKYNDKTSTSFIPHATLEELITYYTKRDSTV